VGAFGVNWLQSILTTQYPDLWILVLGGLFVGVVLFFPEGLVGTAQKLLARFAGSSKPLSTPSAPAPRPSRLRKEEHEVAP
jgi:urea transport system permease protein